MNACHRWSGIARAAALAGVGVCLLGSAPRGGGDGGALRMSVSTNSVVSVGVRVRAGQELMRAYRLRNLAEYGLRDVKVVDAQAVGGVAACPRASLAPLGTMVCRAAVRAVAGRHVVRVTATGVPTWEEYGTAAATASAGYDARASVLTLERAASQKRLFYRLVYSGPAALENVRLRDPLLDPAALRCVPGGGLPARLPTGSALECSAPAPDRPGPHESVARATGTTADEAVSPAGTPLPPLALEAEAPGGYTVPVPPRRARPVAPVGQAAGGRRGPGAPLRGAPPRPGPPAAVAPLPGGAPPAPLAPGFLAGLGVPVPPGVAVPPGIAPGGVAGVAPAGRTPGRAVPTTGPLPPDTAVAAHRPQRGGSPLDEGMDWAFISLVVVAFPALLVAITSVSRKSAPQGGKD
ncbi:hypothetical protein [Streptomyces sp. cg36]|uniref:hypothetical protein n=1 Tax=Streptomyces sp. cg36 TaxID=3238798 RepID=UPI0034E2CD9F